MFSFTGNGPEGYKVKVLALLLCEDNVSVLNNAGALSDANTFKNLAELPAMLAGSLFFFSWLNI